MTLERCPRCGARNAATSPWCGQCHAILKAEAGGREPSGSPDAGRPSPEQPPGGRPETPDSSAAGAPRTLGAALLSTALGVTPVGSGAPPAIADPQPEPPRAKPGAEALQRAEWTCAVCGSANPYADDVCAACGASLFAPLKEVTPLRDVPARRVLAASAAPGGGFFVLGLTGAGVLRLLLVAWSLGTGLALASLAPGRLIGVRLLFLAAGVAVWAASAWDAVATQRRDHGSVLLRGRVIMVAVAGLLVVLVFSMLSSTRPPSPGDLGQDPPSAPPSTRVGPFGPSPTPPPFIVKS